MKRVLRIIFIVLIVLVLLWTGLVWVVSTAGKGFLAAKLRKATGKDVAVDSVSISAPFTVIVTGLSITDVLEIESVKVTPGFLPSLLGKFVITELVITRPKLNLTVREPAADSASKGSGKRFPLDIWVLKIQNAEVSYLDKRLSTGEVSFNVKSLNAHIRSPYTHEKTDFKLDADFFIAGNLKPSTISASGWLNWLKKDIKAQLSVRGFDAMDFYPYFADKIDLAKAGFKDIAFDFSSDISGSNNDVKALCRVLFTEISFRPLPKGTAPQDAERIARILVKAMEEVGGGKAYVDFVLQTKLDDPRVNIGKTFATALEEKIKNSIIVEKFKAENLGKLPVTLLSETLKGAAGVPRNVWDGTRNVGEGLKGIFIDSLFKVKKKPQQ